MAAVKEGLLLCCENDCKLFEGQNCDIYRETLADGLLLLCEIGKGCIDLAKLLEGLYCSRISVVCWAWICSFTCYYVELLSEFNVNVMPGLCAS